MSKHISFRYGKPLKTAVVLLALAMGVFSSRADHFLWSDFDTTVTAPIGTAGTNETDPVWEWGYGSSYTQDEEGGGEANCTWSDFLSTTTTVDTHEYYDKAVTTGHSLYVDATIFSGITGDWVSDDDGPPDSATVNFTAYIDGSVEAQTIVQQGIDPVHGDNGDINYFMASAGAEFFYSLERVNLPSFGDQALGVSGGMSNGVPNSAISGNAAYFGPAEIIPHTYTLEHDYDPDALNESWEWIQYVSCFLYVSDSYTLPIDSVSANAHLEAISYADILLNTDETSWTRVQANAESASEVTAEFVYTITPNY